MLICIHLTLDSIGKLYLNFYYPANSIEHSDIIGTVDPRVEIFPEPLNRNDRLFFSHLAIYIHFFSVGLSCDIIVQSKAFITGFWF